MALICARSFTESETGRARKSCHSLGSHLEAKNWCVAGESKDKPKAVSGADYGITMVLPTSKN